MFNPPTGVTNGAQYTYGNIVWEFNAESGVWNVVSGSLIGAKGDKGDKGDAGDAGPLGNTGATGAGSTGDNGAYIVTNGVGTVRVATVGATGVAAFPNADFGVSITGTVSLTGNVARTNVAKTFTTLQTFSSGISSATGAVGSVSFPAQTLYNRLHFKNTTNGSPSTNYIYSGRNPYNIPSNFSFGDYDVELDTSGSIWASFGKNISEILTSLNVVPTGSQATTLSVSSAAGLTPDTAAFKINTADDLPGSYAMSLIGQVGDTVYYWMDSLGGMSSGSGATWLQNISAPNLVSFNTVSGSQHKIPYVNTSSDKHGGLTTSSTLAFNGTSLTFGSTTSTFTVTGPNMILGAATQITGGVFKNPTEFAPHYQLAVGTNDIVVNGASGSIQRYTIQPNATVTIKAGSSWHSLTGATETIAVIIQNRSGYTGQFDSSILADGVTRPVLFNPAGLTTGYGVTGGISTITIMRVNIDGTKGLTMGFVVASGITAPNLIIN